MSQGNPGVVGSNPIGAINKNKEEMTELFRRYTFTMLLGLLGFLIGFIIIIDLGLVLGQDISVTFQDPISPLAQYFGKLIKVLIKAIIFGIILGLILSLIGLVLDIYKRKY